MEKKSFPYGRAISIALFLIALFVISTDDVASFFKDSIGEGAQGILAYVAFLALAIVVAPISALPIIPLAAGLFGPFATGVASVIGWTLGSAGAFLIARYVGRPVLRFVVPLEKIDSLQEKLLLAEEFWGLVLLRIVIPTDILSYAVGLLTRIRFTTYVYATALGVAPFSFIFAYGGQAIAERSFFQLLGLVIVGGVLFYVVYVLAKRARRPRATNAKP